MLEFTPMLRAYLFLSIIFTLPACDSIEPVNDDFLVVEGYFDAEKPLPPVTLLQAQPLDASPEPVPVRDALFELILGDQTVTYIPSSSEPGKYEPLNASTLPVAARARIAVDIQWNGQQMHAEDIVPPSIQLDSVSVKIPDTPVAAILVDTLRLDTPQVGARKGYIFPVDVQLWWKTDFQEIGVDSLYWVETRLRPQLDFSSKVLDVFLRTEEVQRERIIQKDGQARRFWKGVYAVPAADSLAPIPDHTVQIQLVRGSEAYGLYASSRNAPERREPVSNIEGAIGIIAGVSLATITYEIKNGEALRRVDN